MKILLLHDKGTATGGAEMQFLALRDDLRALGHDARLLATSATPVPGSSFEADYRCFGTNNQKLQVLTQTANPAAYLALRQILRDFQPDVVHARLFLWQLSPLILPLLRDLPALYQTSMYKAICPVGTKILPDGSPCTVRAGVPCLRNRCMTPQTWGVLMGQRALWLRWRDAFDLVAALSSEMRDKLVAEGIGPVEVVHNGVAERPPRPRLATQTGEDAVPTVVYAGRLVPEKGVDVLLRALARVRKGPNAVPNARLLAAGQGTEAESLRVLASELGLADAVTWLGHLPREEMERHFDSAWVQAVPSLWAEPFGNVSTEAMMRGTAVVASAVGGQTDIVIDGQTGFLVPPGDVDALAARLRYVLRDRTVAETMGQIGRRRALAQFSEAYRTQRFVEIYERLLALPQYASRAQSNSPVSALNHAARQ